MLLASDQTCASFFTPSHLDSFVTLQEDRPRMAITNFIVTVLGVGAVVLLLRSDVKQSANIFKRNVRQIRTWLEEESNAVSKGEHGKPKEIDPHVPEKNVPKEDKH